MSFTKLFICVAAAALLLNKAPLDAAQSLFDSAFEPQVAEIDSERSQP